MREVHITSFAKVSFLFTSDGYCIEEAQEYPDIDSGNGDILISGSSWLALSVVWKVEVVNHPGCFGV